MLTVRTAVLLAVLIAAGLTEHARAVDTQNFNQDYVKLIRSEDEITPLGVDLLGDHTNLYTGSTDFSAVDVSIPGNSSLPVAVGRRFPIGDRGGAFTDRLFGDWDIDLPYLHGTYARSHAWQVNSAARDNRCAVSGSGIPGTGTGWNKVSLRLAGNAATAIAEKDG